MDMPAPILIPDNAETVWLSGDPGTSVAIFKAAADIAAGEPVIGNFAGATGTVIPFDGGSSTDVMFYGVALSPALSGEDVTVVTRGVATVAKDTGTAWAIGDVIGAGAAKTANVYAPDLDGVNVAKQTLGYAIKDALSGDSTGLIWVNAAGF